MAKTLTDQEKKEILERFAKEKQGCFYSVGNATENLVKYTGVKSSSNWIKPLFGQSPTEFYMSHGLIMQQDQLPRYCETVFQELEKRHQDKPAVDGLYQLQENYSDLDLSCFGVYGRFEYLRFVAAGILMHPFPTKTDKEKIIESCMKAIRNDAYANRFLSSFARDDDMAQYISMRDIKLSMYKVSHILNDPTDPEKGETVWAGMEDEVLHWIEDYQGMPIAQYFTKEGILRADRADIAKKMLKGAERYHAKNGPAPGIDYVHAEAASKKVGAFQLDDDPVTYWGARNLFHYLQDEGEEMGLSAEDAEARAKQVFINKGFIEGVKNEAAVLQPTVDSKSSRKNVSAHLEKQGKTSMPSSVDTKTESNTNLDGINIYKCLDESIKKLLIGDKDPIEAIEKRKFPRKAVFEVETEQGTVSVTNQAHTDIKRSYNDLSSWDPYYDMYIAKENYLTKEEMAERIQIVDKGHTDASYYAEPEIDWIAEALTKEQIATRILLLATVADKLLTSDYIKEIIASMPKTKKGDLMKNRVTRIASGNIVTQKAKVLELVARAKTEKNVVISAEFRTFSSEELKTIEGDFLSTHISALGWEAIPKVTKQEKTEQPKPEVTKETVYKPESFAWENAQYNRGLASKRYDGITLRFDIVWDMVRKNGYSYKNAVDETEKIIAKQSCYVWAPLQGRHSFPWEKPHDKDPVRLGEIIVSSFEANANQFPDWMNHFFFILDMACLKDAIRKHDLALLQERARFLSPENIDECIRFAKEEKMEECVAWLDNEKEKL